PNAPSVPLQVSVKVNLKALGECIDDKQLQATFAGEYFGRFVCPPEMTEDMLNQWIQEEPNQYSMFSQVFPLAMMHFRRELMFTGFDSKALPLGL
ncbi:MAG TPA: hypothetical protein VFW93_15555, partial [Aquabacterium sp.]|uniref:hypothetical protein n=1 Tax=Aquabacterium sp. TaxID=1872578 RepID=UPI002E31FD3B